MEQEFHRWLRSTLPQGGRQRLGVGDDAAILWLNSPGCVVTTDTISDEVDFHLTDTEPRRIGHKSLAVNLSDLAAMAARPCACVVALLLPRSAGIELAQEIIAGMLPIAEEFGCPVAGGDVHVWDHPLAITVTAIGEVALEEDALEEDTLEEDENRIVKPNPTGGDPARSSSTAYSRSALPLCRPLTRSGAEPGDAIVVTGAFGGSLLGRHLDVRPRLAEALELQSQYDLHAAIDVSDGLSLDLARLCDASGLGAEIQLHEIPIHKDAARLAEKTGRPPLEHALDDGEDFELVITAPGDVANRMLAEFAQRIAAGERLAPLRRIGVTTANPGIIGVDHEGAKRELKRGGFEHGGK